MAQNGNQTDEMNQDVQLSTAVLGEQTLAVDLARADLDSAIATAHRFPRILDTVIKKIETMACYNEAAAANSIYSLPRGGKPILGPSIGFANITAAAWGNCTDGARIVYVDRKEKVIIAEGGFHDLETNRKTMLPVQRRICGRDGRLYNDDMIMVTGMAAASIARRNAILNAVPRALWFPIYERALEIVRGNIETFAERKDKALKAFAQFGVKPEQVYMVLGLKGEADLTLEHIPILRGMYSTLREGTTTVEEMFDPRKMSGTAFEKVENPLGDEQPPTTETVDAKTGEVKPTKAKKRGRPTTQKADAPAAEAPAAAQEAVTPPQETAPNMPPRPKTPDEYRVYLQAWLMQETKVAHVEDRWRQDRNVRGECGIIEEQFNEVKAMKDKRVAELQAQ